MIRSLGGVRTLTMLVAAVAVATSSVSAQTTTFEYLQGGNIEEIKFVDSSNGFAVADGGRIHYSTNGGVDWAEAETDNVNSEAWGSLHGMTFRGAIGTGSFKGWAVGENGVILTTIPSDTTGQEWELHNGSNRITSNLETASPSDCGTHYAVLRDIVMITDSYGWAVGDDGTLVSTTNNWTSWTDEVGPSEFSCSANPNDIYQIHFFPEHASDGDYVAYDKGIIVSEYGRVFRTEDAGATWSEQTVGLATGCTGVNYPFMSIGDGDPTQAGHDGDNLELWEIAFDDPDDADTTMTVVGGVGNSQGYIYRTTSSGWSTANCGVWSQELNYNFVHQGANSHTEVCGLSTLYSADIVDFTASPPQPLITGYAGHLFTRNPSGVANFDTENCTATCTGGCAVGTVWYQHDTVADTGGPSPVELEYPFGNNAALLAGARVTDKVAVVGGHFGVMTRYDANETDPGDVLTEVGTKWVTRLSDGDFWSSTTGVVVGQGGQILKTTNGGLDWSIPSSPPWDLLQYEDHEISQNAEVAQLYSVAFSGSGEYGVTVGSAGAIAYTDDYAATWTSVTLDPGSHYSAGSTLNDVEYVGGTLNTFVAAGNEGRVLISEDGGATWDDIELGSSHPTTALHGVHFPAVAFTNPPTSPQVGYAVGENAKVYRTTNRGRTWSTMTVNGASGETLFDVVSWVGGAVVVGQNGAVFERSSGPFEKQSLGFTVDQHLLDVDEFGDGATLRISGQGGVILFRDSGTWSQPRSRTSLDVTGLSFLNPSLGFAIGKRSGILKYDDT